MKMKKLALLLLLVCPALGFARDYTCSGPGTRNWHTLTDWVPNGIPGFGDTATISQSCIMQCEASQVCALGKGGVPGSTDLNIQVGGDLIVDSGAYFDMRGDVLMSGELDIFGGTFAVDPSVAGGAALYYIDGGNSTGAVTLKVCSESSCSSSTGTLAVLTCKQGASGSCQIRHITTQGNGMNVLGSHGQISNFGAANTPAIDLNDGTLPPVGGFVLKNNFSLHSNGVIRVGYNSPTVNLTFDGVSFDTLVDTRGSYNGYTFLELFSFVAPTSGDRTLRLTCANTLVIEASIFLDVVKASLGDSSHPGLVAYNCKLVSGLYGGNFQNVLSIIDRSADNGTSLEPAYNADATFQDWVMLDHTPNQHHIGGINQNGGGVSNTYKRVVFDGDGFSGYDTGDDYQDLGTYTATNSLHINSSGTAVTLSASSAQKATLEHETLYNTYGGVLCETGCAASMLQSWSNSLIVAPSQIFGTESAGNDGLHNSTAFNQRQSSNSSATDYNFFWQMPGSGDPGAGPAKNILIQLNLGPTPSWVAMTNPGASFVHNQQAVVNGVNIFCSGCFLNAQSKDYVVDTTQQPNTYAVIRTVTNGSNAVLYASIPHYSTGDLVDVRPGYFAVNGLYGVDWGAHDQHINPWFQDTTRTVCTWWKQQSGSLANCTWPNGNAFTAGQGTNSTMITDPNVNFNALGVQDGVDVVMVYAGWSVLGSGMVLSHTSTTLTVTPISGAGPGDNFSFITAPATLGPAAVQLYGFDINGNPVTPPAWVNSNIVQSIESYLQQGYTPTNLALFGAASDGKSVGAVEVLPPNGGVSVSSN